MDEKKAQGSAYPVNLVGRPTLYRPEFCDLVINLSNEEQWVYEWAHEIGVCTDTLDNWAKSHPEFKDAYIQAKVNSIALLFKKARHNLCNKDFQAKVFEFMYRSKIEGLQKTTVSLPALKDAKTHTAKCEVIISALSDESITLMQAEILLRIISAAAKVEEVTDLKEKLKAIEEKING